MTLRVHPDDIVAANPTGLLATHPSWKRVRLGQIADVLNGFAFPSSGFGASGDIPLIRIRDVGRENSDTWFSGSYDDAYVVESGSLLIGMDGDFRVDRWVGPAALLNQRVCKLTVWEQQHYSERFLRWVLPGYLDAIHRNTSSVTVKHLSSETIKEIPLPLPPRLEQERVVAAIEEQFSRLDAAEQSLHRGQGQLNPMRSSILSASVSEGDPTDLGDLLDDIEAGTSFRANGAPAAPDQWGVIKVSAMTWGRFLESENKALPETTEISPRYEIRPGDLLLSRANTRAYVGATVLVENCRPRLLLSDKSMRLHVVAGVDKAWLAHALSSPWLREQMSDVATGTKDSMRNISQAKVRRLKLRVPSPDRQRSLARDIDRHLSLLNSFSRAIEHSLTRCGRLRRSILAAAFSGQLAPQDPSEEPASLLLERIAAERSNGRTPTRGGRSRSHREKITL